MVQHLRLEPRPRPRLIHSLIFEVGPGVAELVYLGKEGAKGRGVMRVWKVVRFGGL